MTRFGSNMKWTASRELRDAMDRLFVTALGCAASDAGPDLRLYRFADGGNVGVYYVADDSALPAARMKDAAWLEFLVADVEATRAALARAGVEEFEYVDRDHPYFTAPNGQVFRLARAA